MTTKPAKPVLFDVSANNALVVASSLKAVVRDRSAYGSTEPRAMRKEIELILDTLDPQNVAETLLALRRSRVREKTVRKLEEAFKSLVTVMQDDMGYSSEADLENFKGTPRRAAEAFYDMHGPKHVLEQEVRFQLESRFPADNPYGARYASMVAITDIRSFGLCPHHLLPIEYVIHVAYIPMDPDEDETEADGEMLGLSKIPRIAEAIAQQPILHEDVGERIASLLCKSEDDALGLNSLGSAVIVVGKHMCMCARGVKQHDAVTTHMALRGAFRDPIAKEEFLAHVARDARLKL